MYRLEPCDTSLSATGMRVAKQICECLACDRLCAFVAGCVHLNNKLAAINSTSMQILVAMAAVIHKLHQNPGLQATLNHFDLHSLLLADNMVKYSQTAQLRTFLHVGLRLC